ncbi:MAG: cytochrome P450 [Myxococcales bacterium]|nr:cytochrome P450 [Myxococcales bacterium]
MTDHLDYDPFRPEVQRDPYPYYAALREHPGLFRVESSQAWAVARYDDVHHVLRHPEVFSSHALQTFLGGSLLESANRGPLRFLSHPSMGHLARGVGNVYRYFGRRTPMFELVQLFLSRRAVISADPPDHTRLRHLVNRGFTPRRIAALEPRIREIARDCLDAMEARDEADLMRDFAVPLPVTVIAELLGVPEERFADFKRWSDAVVQGVSLGGDSAPQRVIGTMLEFVRYLEELIEERRAHPTDDLVSVLVRDEAGGKLDVHELMLFLIVMLVAGNETTTNLIGNAIHLLLDRPEDLASVEGDASLVPGLVEEALRYVSPIQMLPRVAKRDTELSGTKIREGENLMVLFASANRDSRKYPDGDAFDLRRDPKEHVAFCFGIHYCLGASLARLEGRVAFEELFARFRKLRRAPGEVSFLESGILRGPKTLPVAFDRPRVAA